MVRPCITVAQRPRVVALASSLLSQHFPPANTRFALSCLEELPEIILRSVSVPQRYVYKNEKEGTESVVHAAEQGTALNSNDLTRFYFLLAQSLVAKRHLLRTENITN